MDKAEADYVTNQQITSLSVQRLREHPASLSEALHATAMPLLHVHCDLDVLDPEEFPHVSVHAAGGLSVCELAQTLRHVSKGHAGRMAGFTMTEFRPRGSPDDKEAAVKVIDHLLGPEGIDLKQSMMSYSHNCDSGSVIA